MCFQLIASLLQTACQRFDLLLLIGQIFPLLRHCLFQRCDLALLLFQSRRLHGDCVLLDPFICAFFYGTRAHCVKSICCVGSRLTQERRVPRTAASSSRNGVNFSSACTTKRFPSSRCASAIQIVRPLESIAETQPQLQPALLSLSASISQYFREVLWHDCQRQIIPVATFVVGLVVIAA